MMNYLFSNFLIILAGLPAMTQYPYGKDLVTIAPAPTIV